MRRGAVVGLATAHVVLLVCPTLTAGSMRVRLTATAIRRQVAAEGADKVIRRLFEDRRAEEALLNGIGTGGDGWLQVAAQLRPHSDGAASLGLNIAVQDALPRNPVGVLRLIRSGAFDVKAACGNYGSGQMEERPVAVIQRLIQRRMNAVTAVRESALSLQKQACLNELGDIKGWVARR